MNSRILMPVVLMFFGMSLFGSKAMAQFDLRYAFVTVSGVGVQDSGETIDKLNITVDLGNLSSQQQLAEGYAFKMKDYQSVAAVLNFMANKGFKLIDTIQFERRPSESDRTAGVHFIFEKE